LSLFRFFQTFRNPVLLCSLTTLLVLNNPAWSNEPLELSKQNTQSETLNQQTLEREKHVAIFFQAVQQGQIEVVRKLLDSQLSPDLLNKNGQAAIHLLAKNRDIRIWELLIDHGADVNALNEKGQSPLFIAIEADNNAVFERLIQAKAEIHGDRYNASALEYALRFKRLYMAEYLAENTSALSDKKPHELLFNVVNAGSLPGLKWLLSKGFDANVRGRNGETLLMEASLSGGQDMIEHLVQAGVDINAKDKMGRSVLFYLAGSLRRPQMLAYLLEHGADVNMLAAKETLQTPLLVAAHGGWYDNILVLLEFGADTRALDALGRNALAVVLTQGGATSSELKKIVPLLLNVEVPVNQKDHQGTSPIHIALQQGASDLVEKMLRQGAPLEIQSEHTALAFLEAIRQNKMSTVRYLIEHQIPLEGPLYLDNLPLGQAASGGHLEILKYILDQGANINAQDVSGHTALHQSCILGCKKRVLQYLLQTGADPQLKSERGHTVLDLAKNWNDKKAIRLIEAALISL